MSRNYDREDALKRNRKELQESNQVALGLMITRKNKLQKQLLKIEKSIKEFKENNIL